MSSSSVAVDTTSSPPQPGASDDTPSGVGSATGESQTQVARPPLSAASSGTQVSEKDALVSAMSTLIQKMEEMIDVTRSEALARNPNFSLPIKVLHSGEDVDHRPATISWLKSKWDLLVPYLEDYWITLSLVFLAAVISVSIGVGWAFKLHPFDIADDQSPQGNAVMFSATLIAIDPVGQTMTMDWFAQYPCNVTADPGDCPNINIFFDEASLRSATPPSDNSVSSNTKPGPTFFFNTTDWFLAIDAGTDGRISSPIFRTNLAITSDDTGRTLQSYPFDKYYGQISIFAQNAADNSSVTVSIIETNGLAVGFNAELQRTNSGAEDNFGTLLKTIVVTRGQVVRVYAILVVVAVWLVTLSFMGACIASVFLGKGMSSSVLALPVATLFAFTQLRGTLPGAPTGFGADIDFIGILPCLALLTFCSVFMTAIFLFRNPEQDSPRWEYLVAQYEKVHKAKGYIDGQQV